MDEITQFSHEEMKKKSDQIMDHFVNKNTRFFSQEERKAAIYILDQIIRWIKQKPGFAAEKGNNGNLRGDKKPASTTCASKYLESSSSHPPAALLLLLLCGSWLRLEHRTETMREEDDDDDDDDRCLRSRQMWAACKR